MSETADVIVIGLGAFGSATTYQLARSGAKVIGIDRFAPPHDRGSSHGATRITRLAVGEGDIYVPLVKRANEIWEQLEAETGNALYMRTGGLIMGPRDGNVQHHGKPDFVRRTADAALRYGIPHEVLSASEIADRFPQFQTRGDELGYFEPDSGVLKPELCVQTQLLQAKALGATLRLNERAMSIDSTPGGVTVRTSTGTYSAAKAIVTAGPWVPGMVGGAFAGNLRVMRQVLYWFEAAEPSLYASPSCPVFIWMHGSGDEDYLYGFPMVDGYPGVKVATEQYQSTTNPDEVEREVQAVEHERMFERNVNGRLRSVTAKCVHSAACLYTVSSDSGFIVDQHPDLDHVTVVSACSGHGFKHSAAMGELLARQAMGTSVEALSAFSLARFAR